MEIAVPGEDPRTLEMGNEAFGTHTHLFSGHHGKKNRIWILSNIKQSFLNAPGIKLRLHYCI